MIGAVFIVGFGLTLPITGYELIDIWITVFWLVGITNAVNLLDNMDGLAAGIATIGAVAMAIAFAVNGQVSELILMSVFVGALGGFLIFNFNPASIFMGDCGSMFVGFFLASSVLLNQTGGRSRRDIFDSRGPGADTFRADLRYDAGNGHPQALGTKGVAGWPRPHVPSARRFGLSERAAVLMIYGFAIIAGLLSLLVSRLATMQSLADRSIFGRPCYYRRVSFEGKSLRGNGRGACN